MTINYNIWKVFYLLLFMSILFMSYISYNTYTSVRDRYQTQVHHYTEIIAAAVSSDIQKHDMLLTVLGNQLLRNNNYKDLNKTKIILDNLLEQNSYLAGFGLLDINGNMIAASSNITNIERINVLKNKKTHDGFKKTLTSKNIIVGRTYFFKAANKWIIPLRKVIVNEDGVVLGVMTTGLVNDKNTNFLDTLTLSKDKSISIVRDFDNENKMYRQYMSSSRILSLDTLYNTPISDEVYNSANSAIEDKYNYKLSKLRVNNKTVSIEFVDTHHKKIIAGMTYNKKYNLWILVHGDASKIWSEFLELALIYAIIFILSFIVIFILFKNIALYDRRKKAELVYQAQHDALTGLPNRTYMYKHMKDWQAENIEKYNVLYLDLDNFKNINDKFGHTVGDALLVEVAHRLKSFFNENDMLIRQGGDEFIVLRESQKEDSVDKCLTALIEQVSKVYYIEGKEFRIGLSVGLSQYPTDASSIEKLLSLADTAMYEAKKRKNSFCTFSEDMRHESIIKSDIEHELRGAIENSELWMVYQPQINADGTLYGLEALVRWNNKKLGFVGPDKFISIAESTGLIREIGEFVILTSLREIQKVKSDLNLEFSLSVNISIVQLMEDDFLVNILKQIEAEKFNKNRLTLEITESLSIEDIDAVLPVLHAIREEGVKISLDDFGTGYSSLSVLKNLPINELKIDKSFVDEVLYDKSEKALIQSIINIGKSFGMKTLAEGVESLSQVELLREFNCDIFQGYYFSKPLNKDDLVEYLKNQQKDK